jgi:hypothetical protein
MNTVLAHAQVIMAESAIEGRSKAEDHAEARFGTLDKRRAEQKEVLEVSEQTQAELDQDLLVLEDKADNKFLGIRIGHKKKIEKLGNELAENQAVAEAAAQTNNVLHGDQQAVFEEVKKANERVSTAVGYVQETLQAVAKASAEGGLA